MLKRATIVGETTAGGAHAGVWHRIDDHYGMAIPESRAVNPYSKSDWEATGIQPDIKVPRATALRTALRQAQSQLPTR
jgi:C-terminal processing protease CtpA/Prc